MWFVWSNENSPLYGKDKMTTFERYFIEDRESYAEEKNAYYRLYDDEKTVRNIFREFGIDEENGHIINGHVPVRSKNGESPVKCGGKILVIDGGFCKAYQPTSGIAGYTLIYNSRNIRIVSHQPFAGREEAILHNHDIANDSVIFERMENRVKIAETDIGKELKHQAADLRRLLEAYRSGAVTEDHKE